MTNSKRYYLHKKIRKTALLIRIEARKRTLFVPHPNVEEAISNKWVHSLMSAGYSLQVEII